jgi:hypothetical protein
MTSALTRRIFAQLVKGYSFFVIVGTTAGLQLPGMFLAGDDSVTSYFSNSARSERKRFTDVFQMVEEIQLSTGQDHLIGGNAKLSAYIDGSLLVRDPMFTRSVYLFRRDGSFAKLIGGKGKGPGEYLYPAAHGFDKLGNIYVYDGDQLRLNRYDRNGEFVQSYFLGKYFGDIAFTKDGDVFLFSESVSDAKGSTDATVFRYDTEGRLVSSFCPQSKNYFRFGASAGGGIEVTDQNLLYCVSAYEYKIRVFKPDGTLLKSFGEIPGFYKPPRQPPPGFHRQISELHKWHTSWTHIMNLVLIDEQYLLLFMQNFENEKPVNLLDIYDVSGKRILAEVESPLVGTQCTSQGDMLVCIEDSEPDKFGNLLNPKIKKYKLKQTTR